jgi:formiminotetrahydrofolate cyclodeaminase
MSLSSLSVTSLLDAFASSDPTPGGGSAAALAGALGASLLAMVAGMPKTKTGAPEAREALDAARVRIMTARATLTDLIDRDSAAYDLVVSAYRRPKGTDAEKADRKDAIQQAMRVATEVPLETATMCAAVLRDATIVGEHGNPNASSDVGTAIALLRAGIRGAELNVEINVGSLTDAALVAQVRSTLAAAVRAAS